MWVIIDELYSTRDACNSSTVALLKINLTGKWSSITSDPLPRWLDQLISVECSVRSSQSSGFDSHLNFARFSFSHLRSINCMRGFRIFMRSSHV